MNIGREPINNPYEISSNTQFHEKLDQLIQSNPQQHLNEILEVLRGGIQYINQQDALDYLPLIKSKLIEKRVDSNDRVIQKINEICQTLKTGKTITDLPEDVLIYFLKQGDKKMQNKFRETAKTYQNLVPNPELLASILGSNAMVTYDIPLEIKLSMAKKAGEFLKGINLGSPLLLDSQLQEVLKACPNLKKLSLRSCTQITNEGIKNLPNHLEDLKLDFCTLLTEEAIKNLPKDLRKLSLAEWVLTDELLKNLPEKLDSLGLGLTGLKDANLKNLPKELESLELFGCQWLTDEHLKNLPNNLKTLDVSRCYFLTYDGLKNLPKDLHIINY